MRNTTISRVILLGALAILSILAVQSYWIFRQYDLQDKAFRDKVNIALLETARDVAQLSGAELPIENFIKQSATNYYVVNINNVFKASDLEFFLRKNLESVALKEDFEFGVFDCSSNAMVYGKLIDYSDDQKTVDLAQPLPAHHDSDFLYYFGVRFPNRSTAILGDMSLILFFSFLMLLTVAFFIYAITVILRQKQLSELQKDFINNMTHEFKTPISTINVSTDVLAGNAAIREDARLARYTSIIKEQTQRLNNQVEKVLQIARIDRDDIGLNPEPIDLHDLIEQILPSLEIKILEKKGHLVCQLDAQNALVRADRLHLTNVLHNLVDNAVKYCKGAPEIIFSSKNDENELFFSLKDNGIGIPKEHQKRVFDKFYRVPTGNIHNVKGFGLGLFYVKSVAKEHGWRLWLDSEEGRGTTISIRMKTLSPAEADRLVAEREAAEMEGDEMTRADYF